MARAPTPTKLPSDILEEGCTMPFWRVLSSPEHAAEVAKARAAGYVSLPKKPRVSARTGGSRTQAFEEELSAKRSRSVRGVERTSSAARCGGGACPTGVRESSACRVDGGFARRVACSAKW